MSDNPTLIYFPFGGRGELSRLTAAAGGVELDEAAEAPEGMASFFGALPTLKHGEVELCQSQAITSYLVRHPATPPSPSAQPSAPGPSPRLTLAGAAAAG